MTVVAEEQPLATRAGDVSQVRGGHDPAGVAAIELVDVAKEFGRSGDEQVQAVRKVDLAIGAGEFFSLLGPSGCGKTTTLRMIAGFEEPTRGQILLYGDDMVGVPPYRRDVNMVFQSYALFPHMSVYDNIAFGLRRKKRTKREIETAVHELLEIVRLEGKENRRPTELSGGQQQRVALARALVNGPRALLLDEPLAALDLKLRQAMQLELKRIQREIGITFVFVTHDQNEALTLSDRLVVMNEGLVEQLGSPREVYEHPATRFVAGFIGTSNIVSGSVERVVDGTAVVSVGGGRVLVPAGSLAAGETVELTVRPEKVLLHSAGEPAATDDRSHVSGAVTDVTYLGTSTNVTVRCEDGSELMVFRQNAGPSLDVAAGDVVTLSWARDHSAVLSTSTGAGQPVAASTPS